LDLLKQRFQTVRHLKPPARRSDSAELASKPHCVVFTKCDLLGELYVPEISAPEAFGLFAISAPGRLGLDVLIDAWWRQLLAMRKAAEAALPTAIDAGQP
jgi:GTP-binding protein